MGEMPLVFSLGIWFGGTIAAVLAVITERYAWCPQAQRPAILQLKPFVSLLWICALWPLTFPILWATIARLPAKELSAGIKLTERQTAQVLAALRYWQQQATCGANPDMVMHDVLSPYVPLCLSEIDTLCERLNFDGAD